jgi:hypothetical protein
MRQQVARSRSSSGGARYTLGALTLCAAMACSAASAPPDGHSGGAVNDAGAMMDGSMSDASDDATAETCGLELADEALVGPQPVAAPSQSVGSPGDYCWLVVGQGNTFLAFENTPWCEAKNCLVVPPLGKFFVLTNSPLNVRYTGLELLCTSAISSCPE